MARPRIEQLILQTEKNQEPAVYRAGTGKGMRLDAPVFKVMRPPDAAAWLWTDRIPRRQVTLIEARRGRGNLSWRLIWRRA
jgi:hypothetical protein